MFIVDDLNKKIHYLFSSVLHVPMFCSFMHPVFLFYILVCVRAFVSAMFFFCILAKFRLAMHDARSSTHCRALADKKLQMCLRKARSLQDHMLLPAIPQALSPAYSSPQGGAINQSTR